MIKIKWRNKFRGERVYYGYEFKNKVRCGTKGRKPESKRATSQLACKEWICIDAEPFPGSQDPSLGLDISIIYGSFHIK